jgi:hypothetical protein
MRRSASFGVACGVSAVVLAVSVSSAAAAAGSRSERSVAGARALIATYDSDILADRTSAACALGTKAAQAGLAKEDHASTCTAALHLGWELLQTDPKEAAQIKGFAAKAHITLKGSTATVRNIGNAGTTKLSYIKGEWYFSSYE